MNTKGKVNTGNKFFGLWRNLRLKNKLLISIGALIVLITLSILFAVNQVITNNMLRNKEEMVTHTVAGVENLLQERKDILEKYTTFITKNTGFIEAINVTLFTQDYTEIGEQALSLQEETGVERIAICRPTENNKCTLLAYTTGEKKPGESVPTHYLCEDAEKGNIASELLVEDGKFVIKVLGAIRKRGNTVAYIIIDDIIGADLAEQIETSTGAEIAFLINKEHDSAKVITAAHEDLVGQEISGEALGKMLSTHKTTYQSNFETDGEIHMAAYKPLLNKSNEMLGTLMILVHMDDVINMKKNTVKAMSTIGLLAIVIGIFAIIMLVRSIITPVRRLLSTVQAIGEGDLTQKIEESGDDEIGQLSKAFGQMQDNLHNTVRQIKNGVELLDTSSVELSTSSREQADGATQQSAALTETSSTVEELATTSKQIAENARTVAELATQSLAGMEEIRTNTNQEATRILTLGEKSQSIGEVVGLIDDIAKQTNILALNASIEAERAGEAGKGFAVVAIEIRALATNVAKSTKQIREIIKEIQDATNASVMATENVGKSVKQGIDLSKQTADSIDQISEATEQQGGAAGQVVTAVKQMSNIAEQTSTGANQIADTAHKLVKLTADQKKVVSQFRIE